MRILKVELRGHLTQSALLGALRALEPIEESVALLIDATAMTGYDLAARTRFVEWNRRNRAHVQRVAIVTSKLVWRTVISAMSLASSQQMKPFASAAEAAAWAARG